MQKELNPQLFGRSNETSGSTVQDLNRLEAGTKDLEAQILSARTHVTAIDRKVSQMQTQFEELTRSLQARLERFAQQVARVEVTQAQSTQETAAKYAGLAGKFTERKVSDAKVQEMVDRHNTLVLSFENKLTHMTRMLSEQEMKLHNSSAALEDARQEIARLRAQPRTL